MSCDWRSELFGNVTVFESSLLLYAHLYSCKETDRFTKLNFGSILILSCPQFYTGEDGTLVTSARNVVTHGCIHMHKAFYIGEMGQLLHLPGMLSHMGVYTCTKQKHVLHACLFPQSGSV